MLTTEQISEIVLGQTEVSYAANGGFLVRRQMRHAIEQALSLDAGGVITLPNRVVMEPEDE